MVDYGYDGWGEDPETGGGEGEGWPWQQSNEWNPFSSRSPFGHLFDIGTRQAGPNINNSAWWGGGYSGMEGRGIGLDNSYGLDGAYSSGFQGGYPTISYGGGGGYPGGAGFAGGYGGAPQQQMWEWMAPILEKSFSGNPYNIPNINQMLPSKQAFENIDPSVWEGIMDPYNRAEDQLMETLGAGGQLGSARGGFSGQGAAGVGSFWGKAAPTIGTTAWGMIGPQMQEGWEANLQRNMYGPNLASSLVGGTYPTPIIKGEESSGFEDLLGYGALAAQIYGGAK